MNAASGLIKRALGWPMPAVITWLVAWCLAWALSAAGAPLWLVLVLPTALGALAAMLPAVAATSWRRVFVAVGFPMSVLAMGWMPGQGGALSAWLWLAPLAVLLLAYPRRAWRDAPVFPTPRGALSELPKHVKLPAGARVLDAGCGMGDGLIELNRALPGARIEGVEWSALWRFVSAWRCPWAMVRQGDMWADDWSAFDVVYLFQRPETMPRAMQKAAREMRAGCWLISLEFEARDDVGVAWRPTTSWPLEGQRKVWLYRLGGQLTQVS